MLSTRSLAAAAALFMTAVPAMPLVAQGNDTTPRRDTSMMQMQMGDSGRMHRDRDRDRNTAQRAQRPRRSGRAAGGRVSTAGLGRIELIALQQQLRDDGCGVRHVTGRMDATTRAAIRRCMSRYNVTSGSAAELVDSMKIGFGPSDSPPSLATARSGATGGAGGVSGAMGNEMAGQMNAPSAGNRGMRRGRMGGTRARGMRNRQRMMRDSAGMHNDMNMGNMRDTTGMMRDTSSMNMHMRRDSTMNMPMTNPSNPTATPGVPPTPGNPSTPPVTPSTTPPNTPPSGTIPPAGTTP